MIIIILITIAIVFRYFRTNQKITLAIKNTSPASKGFNAPFLALPISRPVEYWTDWEDYPVRQCHLYKSEKSGLSGTSQSTPYWTLRVSPRSTRRPRQERRGRSHRGGLFSLTPNCPYTSNEYIHIIRTEF